VIKPGAFYCEKMEYIEIILSVIDIPVRELLLARLTEMGFIGFEEEENQVKAFIESKNFKEEELQVLVNQFEVDYSKSIIAEQNWNALWESNFDPVMVDDFVGIRAEFHPPFQKIKHEIVITPKMSFGTGHHATTFMMIRLMRWVDFTQTSVFDFGTGTGVLAILAEKLGAARVLAADNDDWCIRNASENFERNHCKKIELRKVVDARTDNQFHIILANINKNIILDNLQFLANSIIMPGKILLSGLLKEDEQDILEAVAHLGWKKIQRLEKDNWIALYFETVG
jgi:ribosomal protein L11 methyltransferase